MIEYLQYLKQVYPQGARFDSLLPQSSYKNCIDLRSYNLECLGEIGAGALSTVYKVKDMNTHEIYACKYTSLKHINGGGPCAASFIAEKALQEIELMLKLRKKGVYGIMPLYGFYPSQDTIRKFAYLYRFIPRVLIPESSVIIELLPLAVPFRTFMDELFRSRRRLNVDQTCSIFLDILSPLEHMHDKVSVVHRDIKIDNLMLIKIPSGTVRIAISDFNISRELQFQTDSYTAMGTPGYCNPRIMEKAINRERVTRDDAVKADLYGAAQCMYVLLNRGVMAPNKGEIPAPKDTPSVEFTDLLRSILNPNVSNIPDCAAIRKRIEAMMEKEHLPDRKSHNTPKMQKKVFGTEKKLYPAPLKNGGHVHKPQFPKGSF